MVIMIKNKFDVLVINQVVRDTTTHYSEKYAGKPISKSLQMAIQQDIEYLQLRRSGGKITNDEYTALAILKNYLEQVTAIIERPNCRC